jgi:hypothetical protein
MYFSIISVETLIPLKVTHVLMAYTLMAVIVTVVCVL